MRILAVDDDPLILETLEAGLQSDEDSVDTCSSGEDALLRVEAARFDVIILDVGLPGLSGFEVAAAVRQAGHTTPIIMLTAQDTEDDTVKGLDSGADDYLTKPFSVVELKARIRALLRRADSAPQAVRSHGEVEICLETRRVNREGDSVRLTEKELMVLWALAKHPLRIWSRQDLLDKVWGIHFDPETKVFDVTLSHLRGKLRKLGAPEILTHRGVGYSLKGYNDESS